MYHLNKPYRPLVVHRAESENFPKLPLSSHFEADYKLFHANYAQGKLLCRCYINHSYLLKGVRENAHTRGEERVSLGTLPVLTMVRLGSIKTKERVMSELQYKAMGIQ